MNENNRIINMNSSQKILQIILDTLEQKNITRKECLSACNINNQNLFSNWKRGSSKYPAYNTVVIIAKYLEIDLDYLFFGTEKVSTNCINEFPLTNTEKEIIICFRNLNTFNQGVYLGELRTLSRIDKDNSLKDVQ